MVFRWSLIGSFSIAILLLESARAQTQSQLSQVPQQSSQQGAFGQPRSFGGTAQGLTGPRQRGSGLGQPQGRGPLQPGRLQGNRMGQDTFIGNDAQQMQESFRRMSGRQQRRAMFDFALESLNELRESRRARDQRRREPSPVRVQIRPTFVSAPPAKLSPATLNGRLAQSLPSSPGAAAQISLNGDTATLSGTVSSEYDRQLAAKMLMLQPGIYQVENRLTVESETGQ